MICNLLKTTALKWGATAFHILANSFCGIVSTETIPFFFFLDLEIVENSNSCRKCQFFTLQTEFLLGYYSSEETIQGQKIFVMLGHGNLMPYTVNWS